MSYYHEQVDAVHEAQRRGYLSAEEAAEEYERLDREFPEEEGGDDE